MRIVDARDDERVMTEEDARRRFENIINASPKQQKIYVLIYNNKIVSISGEYYKIAWTQRRYARNALTSKFGRELSQAMLDYGLIEIREVDPFKQNPLDLLAKSLVFPGITTNGV